MNAPVPWFCHVFGLCGLALLCVGVPRRRVEGFVIALNFATCAALIAIHRTWETVTGQRSYTFRELPGIIRGQVRHLREESLRRLAAQRKVQGQ